MTTDDKIKDKELQYTINREVAKLSALSSGKTDKYEYFTGEEVLSTSQSRPIKQAKFTYTPLGKAFEKQMKTIEDQGITQVEALKVLKPEEKKEDIKLLKGIFPNDMRTHEIKNEIHQIKKRKRRLNKNI